MKIYEIVNQFNKFKFIVLKNKKVVENYFFMTILQILNSLFYLLIYPYLIRTLGAESYGLYVFAFSVSVYFVSLVQFGFDTPALKAISLNPDDKKEHSLVISSVLFSKLLLFFGASIILLALIVTLPFLKNNFWLFIICFFQVFSTILFPTWYFQGIQKMKVVTYIQLSLKILSLPFIYLFVKHPEDVEVFAGITIGTGVIGGVIAMLIIRFHNLIHIRFVPTNLIRQNFKEGFSFFLSTGMNTVKQQAATILLGSFFTMTDVALYDLAMKVYSVPTVLISSINSALFPKMINAKLSTVKNVIKIENLIGVLIILFLIVFGKKIIEFMGGIELIGAYPILIILSFSVFTILTVGAIFNFVFIPRGLYKYIAINQFIALIGFALFTIVGLYFFINSLVLPLAFAFAAIVEFSYSYYLFYKYKNDQ